MRSTGNTIKYDKPFMTYNEMVDLMESRNIIVSDRDFAIMALQNFSYYSLVNGYKDTFIQDCSSEIFLDGTKFEDLYTLHLIDNGLNNILFQYIIYIEKALKSRISYLVSEKFGVYTDPANKRSKDMNDYLSSVHYSNSNNKRSDILYKLKDAISTKRHNPSINHYINDKNHVPAWILTTNISYGLVIEWYGILKKDDKDAVCSTFIHNDDLTHEAAKEFLRKAFMLTKEYRNKIAHGNRTFSILNLPVLPKEATLVLCADAVSEDEYNRKLGQNDITAVLLTIMILFDDKYLLANFINELHNLIVPYEGIGIVGKSIYDVLCLPNDIFDRLYKIYDHKFAM